MNNNRSITLGDKMISGGLRPTKQASIVSPRMRFNYGKHKGEHIENVPVNYLRWIMDNKKASMDFSIQDEIEKIIKDADLRISIMKNITKK